MPAEHVHLAPAVQGLQGCGVVALGDALRVLQRRLGRSARSCPCAGPVCSSAVACRAAEGASALCLSGAPQQAVCQVQLCVGLRS